jgi:hypothetical protein
MKSTRLLLSVAALSAGLICSGGARAEDWKPVGTHALFGVGKAYEIDKGHFYWVGETSGTFLSDQGEKGLFDHAGVKCPSWFDTDLNTKKAKGGGVCVIADHDGDQAYVVWQGEGTPGQPIPITGQFTGGTGKYKEIKGTMNNHGYNSANWSDGTFSGYPTWNR